MHAPGYLEKTGYTNSRLIHITDWMPTILNLAGYNQNITDELGLDGVDQWQAISRDEENARDEMVYNLKIGPVSGAIRDNLEKYILTFISQNKQINNTFQD